MVEEETEYIDENTKEVVDAPTVATAAKACLENTVPPVGVEKEIENSVDNAEEVTDATPEAIAVKARMETVPPVVKIHATAVIDNSPNEALTNDDVNSVAKILTNSDHLAKNIVNIEYSYLSTRQLRETSWG